MDPNTMSMNPFAIKNPEKVASIIADVLKSMQQSEGGKEETFFANLTSDAFQNLAILLKEMYPRLHNGDLPSLEDMLEMLYNFDRVEEMTEEMKKVPELAAKYPILISYFEKNFYKPTLNINGFEIPGTRGSGRKDTERFLYGAITQLNNLLRHPGIKKALCGRTNVINFDNALENGNIITACSRKGDLGVIASKAFGMFFILQFQDAVLRRPGSEDSRIPHFLYIDEFPEYINKDMEVMFTLFRKYRCGTTIAIQNLSQLSKHKGLEYYRQVVLANTKTQIVFGDTVPEDSEYWNKAFGMAKKYDVSSTFDKSTGDFKTKKSAAYKDKERFKVHKISEHGFGAIYFKTKKSNGSTLFGEGKVDFLEAKYKQKHSTYMYDFEKFMLNKPSSGASAYDNKDDTFANNNSSSSNVTYQQTAPSSNQNLINYDIVIDTGNSSPIDHADNFNSNVISFDIDLGNGNKIE
jgi:type IV secretory pathway TraG/TraD family ATPase VirD4